MTIPVHDGWKVAVAAPSGVMEMPLAVPMHPTSRLRPIAWKPPQVAPERYSPEPIALGDSLAANHLEAATVRRTVGHGATEMPPLAVPMHPTSRLRPIAWKPPQVAAP